MNNTNTQEIPLTKPTLYVLDFEGDALGVFTSIEKAKAYANQGLSYEIEWISLTEGYFTDNDCWNISTVELDPED